MHPPLIPLNLKYRTTGPARMSHPDPSSGPRTRGVVTVYPCSYGGVPMPWSNVTVARGFAFVAETEGGEPATLKVAPSIERQAWMCLEKIADRLRQAGTSIDNAVMMTIYVTDIPDYFREAIFVIQRFLKEHCPRFLELPPVVTLVEVGALARVKMKIEIDCIAAMPSSASSREPVTRYPLEYGGVKAPWSKGAVANGFAFLAGAEGWDPQTMEVDPDLEDQVWMSFAKV